MSDRALGGACVAVSAAMAWSARGYAATISYEPVGPSAFPLLLAALMAACGLWLIVRPDAARGALQGVPLKATALCGAGILVYALLFETLGFPLATALMSVPIGIAFGASWKRALLAGMVLGLATWFVFDKLLDVVLPTGLLHLVLGGR
jgi:putative tricarboxylic transport membrane protein